MEMRHRILRVAEQLMTVLTVLQSDRPVSSLRTTVIQRRPRVSLVLLDTPSCSDFQTEVDVEDTIEGTHLTPRRQTRRPDRLHLSTAQQTPIRQRETVRVLSRATLCRIMSDPTVEIGPQGQGASTSPWSRRSENHNFFPGKRKHRSTHCLRLLTRSASGVDVHTSSGRGFMHGLSTMVVNALSGCGGDGSEEAIEPPRVSRER